MKKRLQDNLSVDYWPSFTDALLSVLLVMIFVIVIFVLTQTGLIETLKTKDSSINQLSQQLTEFEKKLTASNTALQALEERYEIKRAQLQEATTKLVSARGDLDLTNLQLARTSETLALQAREIDARETSLTLTGERLTATQSELDAARSELAMASQKMKLEQDRARDLQNDLSASADDINHLSTLVSEYMERIKTLSEQLGATQENLSSRDASLKDLNASVEKFSNQLSKLQSQLGTSQEEIGQKKMEVAKLLNEIEARDQQIEELKNFAKYKSEFLARLADVFKDVPNIRIIGDRFVFQGEILFDSGSAELRESGKDELKKFASIYSSLENKIPKTINLNIQIQGHTDIDPITSGRYKDNWELSTARSLRVMRFLSLMGIPENRLSVAGFSQFHPVVADDSDAAKSQNRRIEILITRI